MIFFNAVSLRVDRRNKRSRSFDRGYVVFSWASRVLLLGQPRDLSNGLTLGVILGFLIASATANAQNLTPSDSLFLEKLRTELQLPNSTLTQIDSIYKLPITRLQEIDKEVNRIARTDIPQSEKDARFVNLRAEKKSLKEDRDLSILRLLNAEQQIIYTTKVVPPKPAVLHMGTNHDRASCTVCIKPQ